MRRNRLSHVQELPGPKKKEWHAIFLQYLVARLRYSSKYSLSACLYPKIYHCCTIYIIWNITVTITCPVFENLHWSNHNFVKSQPIFSIFLPNKIRPYPLHTVFFKIKKGEVEVEIMAMQKRPSVWKHCHVLVTLNRTWSERYCIFKLRKDADMSQIFKDSSSSILFTTSRFNHGQYYT